MGLVLQAIRPGRPYISRGFEERVARELHEAHRLINRVLTTVEGDTIPRGDAPKLHARHLARDVLSRHPQYDPGREGE